MKEEVGLSVIIPGRNQGPVLEKTLSSVYKHKFDFPFEVIYVDGNSTDETPKIIERYQKEHSNFSTFKDTELGPNFRGKGAGVKLGMMKAKGKYRMFMDADSSTPFSEIDKLLEPQKYGYGQDNNQHQIIFDERPYFHLFPPQDLFVNAAQEIPTDFKNF